MPKHDAGHGTQIIGFRVPNGTLKTWQYFADRNGLPLTQFLVAAVNGYVQKEFPAIIARGEGSAPAWVTRGLDAAPQYVNLRLPREIIAAWDAWCAKVGCTRTDLVADAANWVLSGHVQEQPIRAIWPTCKNILLNLVNVLGFLDFPHIAAVFKDLDQASISHMLDALETERMLVRKGQEAYLPAQRAERKSSRDEEAATRDESEWELRFVVQYLSLVTDALQHSKPDADKSEHRRLMQAAIDYLAQYAATVGIDDIRQYMTSLNTESKEQQLAIRVIAEQLPE